MKKLFCFLSAGLLIACADMDYDISDGRLDREITLFEEEISVPIGSIGPITLGSLLLDSSIGQILGDYIQEDARDGSYVLKSESTLFAANVYQLERETDDVEAPFTWEPGSVSGSVEGMAPLLGLLGLSALNQQLEIVVTNPLRDVVPVRATVGILCLDAAYSLSYMASEEASASLRRGSGRYNSLYSTELPAEVGDVVSSVTLTDLALDLPAHPADRIYDPLTSDLFEFRLNPSCRIGFSERFSLTQTVPVDDIGLEIGKYKLRRCEASVEIENTLPLSVTVRSVKALKRGENGYWVSDDNLTVTPGLTVAGGSTLSPGLSQLHLQVAAAEGAVPDIDRLEIELEASVPPECVGVPVTARQGLFVKSSFARIRGGVTIPEN